MRLNASRYRQQVDQYRERLDKLARGELDHQSRPKIVTTPRQTPIVTEPHTVTRLSIYGRRRHSEIENLIVEVKQETVNPW